MLMDARMKMIIHIVVSALIIGIIIILNLYMPNNAMETDYLIKNQPPSMSHIYGTDSLGRDMFVRTVKGLNFSLYVGIIGSSIGVAIAVTLGVIAATGSKTIDTVIMWFVDMFIGLPHLIFIENSENPMNF